MDTYYIICVEAINNTFYVTLPLSGENALEPMLTPYVGNAYLFTKRFSAKMYAEIIESYGFKVDVRKLGFIGSYEV